MLRALVVPVMVVGLGACMLGPSAQTFAPAKWPEGVEANLRLVGGERLRGEVLEVQDKALLVLRNERVVLVPLGVIEVGAFRQRGTLVANGEFLPDALETLRLVCRFPAGLTPALRARLLAAYGQTEPDRVER